MTAITTNVSAKPAAAVCERGRRLRANGKTAAKSSVQPSRWCRNAERWNNHAFCSCTSNAAPDTTNADVIASRHQLLCSLPRTSASSTAPASIITSAQAPCASMCSVELVKKTITGQRKSPSAKTRPGHRYARQARRRQTCVPTSASPRRQSPRSKNPVANSQWTCSARGCTFFGLEVFEQSRQHCEVEEKPGGDHEQRWLDEQPPEALSARMEQRDAVRLRNRPKHAHEGRQRSKGGH